VNGMKTAAETSDFERFYQNDIEFHRTLWRLSQNRYLASCLETLVVPLFAFFLIRTRLDYRVDLLGSAQRHHQLLETIRNGHEVRDRMIASLDSSELFWEQRDARWRARLPSEVTVQPFLPPPWGDQASHARPGS